MAINIYYQNVNGLRSKTQYFYLSVCNCDFDVIMLTETSLNDAISNSELFDISEYSVFRRDRDYSNLNQNKGGGVLIAIRNSVFSNIEQQINWQTSAEDIWISVKCNGKVINFCCAY